MPSIKSEKLIGLARNGCPWIRKPDLVSSLRHKSREEDNRRLVQYRIGLNPCGDFPAVRFRHRHIQQDKIRLKILRGLMSLGRVILFKDEVAARLLQASLAERVKSWLLSTIKIHGLFLIASKACGKKSASMALLIMSNLCG